MNLFLEIKKAYPHIQFILNGGINNLNDAYKYSKKFDGVMLGRLHKIKSILSFAY